MKTKNALTVRPEPGLADIKRAKNLIRLTQSILAYAEAEFFTSNSPRIGVARSQSHAMRMLNLS